MFPVINHELCHAAVDADVFTGYESCSVGAEEQRHFCYIFRLADSAWLLICHLESLEIQQPFRPLR